jgi:hypothetical protein
MNKKIMIAIAVLVLVQLACGPEVKVINNANESVRLSITNHNQHITTMYEPGETQKFDVNAGQYKAVVVPAGIWVEFVKSQEKTISQLLANPDSMTQEQIKQLTDLIDNVNVNEQNLFKNAPDQSTCVNELGDNANGLIEISGSSDSNLSLNCKQVPVETETPQ